MSSPLLKTLQNPSNIFEYDSALQYVMPLIDEHGGPFYGGNDIFDGGWWRKCNEIDKYDERVISRFSRILTRTVDQLYVKMLMEMRTRACSYYDIHAAILAPLGKPVGNDICTFNSLSKWRFVEVDHIGKYKRKYFRLTNLGNRVIHAACTNNVVYRVLRHFMSPRKADHSAFMDDMAPASMVKMLDAILNNDSDLHKLGSYAYWCGKLLQYLKTTDGLYLDSSVKFFNMFNCGAVQQYLAAHADESNVKNFTKVFNRIAKTHAKRAA